jgi:hypothetical protein
MGCVAQPPKEAAKMTNHQNPAPQGSVGEGLGCMVGDRDGEE